MSTLPDNTGFLTHQIYPAVYENVCVFSIMYFTLTPTEKSNRKT
jgi:hypothetical protein